MEKNFDSNNENCIEFLSGERYAVASFTNRRHISRIKKLYEERKEDFKYFVENKDGSICAKFPMKWVKISPQRKINREYSDEERKELAERLKKARERNKNACKN